MSAVHTSMDVQLILNLPIQLLRCHIFFSIRREYNIQKLQFNQFVHNFYTISFRQSAIIKIAVKVLFKSIKSHCHQFNSSLPLIS